MNLDREFTDVSKAKAYQDQLRGQGFESELQYASGFWTVFVLDDGFLINDAAIEVEDVGSFLNW